MAENRSNHWMQWSIVIVVAGAVLAGGVWHFKRGNNDTPQYQTTTVTRGDLTQVVTATGTLNPVVNVTVGSQISGNIAKLLVDYNSQVKSNQVVAELDPALYQAAVEQAKGDLANAKANLELQQAETKRNTDLFKNKLISDSDYDTAIASLHQAEAQMQIKQAALDNAKINLEHCTIYSPVDGVVISRNVDVGQTVAASLSAPTIFVIANDLTKMQIDSSVSEADIGTVEEGQVVNFTVDAFPNRTFTGKVIQIRNSPTNVQNVVTYDAVINVSNPDLKLRPGMTANATIITAERKNALKIPNAAFRFKPPEPSTNMTFSARLLAKIGLGGNTKTSAPTAKADDTNKVAATSAGATLTGNEPPDELQRRVREMRDRGEEVPAEIRAKLREYYQSGVLQRPGGGDTGGGSGAHASGSQPSTRTIYVLVNNPSADEPIPQAVRVKTGINDGTFTEITDGLKEGDVVITVVKYSSAASAAPGGVSPFGGGRRF